MTWKEQKKKKTVVKKEIKPFEIKHYRFFPCVWSKSIKEGYLFYLMVRKHGAYIPRHEFDSPRFKTKNDAIDFVNNNKDTSFVPA